MALLHHLGIRSRFHFVGGGDRRIERRAEEPILPRWVWSRRVLVGANLATIGMGALTMGPNMFLPVFAQSVTGVGAIAAGFILASMSITLAAILRVGGELYCVSASEHGHLWDRRGIIGFHLCSYPFLGQYGAWWPFK